MQARRKALLALVAVVLALLSPAVDHHDGTARARVIAAVPDAVPAARPAPRDHHETGPVLDGAAAVPAGEDPPLEARVDAAPARVQPQPLLSARRTRGPPQV